MDTQEIEGVNGLIKHSIKIAPHIGWELLAARMCARKTLCKVAASHQDDILEECLVHHRAAHAVLREAGRFELGPARVQRPCDEGGDFLWACGQGGQVTSDPVHEKRAA
eukprot:8380597-Alexandrium_andersonii.AAC.1